MNKIGSAITIGTFDGVHKGHELLIKKTIKAAKENGFKSIIIALEKPVKNVSGVLSLYEEKIETIKLYGIDEIIIIPVPSEILQSEPEDFFNDFLVDTLNVSHIVCGQDFAFGKNRKGDLNWIKKRSKQAGIKLDIVKPLKKGKIEISSSYIRKLIENNNLNEANKLLGKEYYFKGIPFRDQGLGKELGFPTVNLKVNKEKLLPKGVFIGTVTASGKDIYPAIVNIGNRPTFNRGKDIVPEVHILNFSGKWNKVKTKVNLIKKIRDEKKFKNEKELQKAINGDIIKAKKFFKL